MISIENSEFFSNSFCKGLISYNHFQPLSYADVAQYLNFTANMVDSREVNYEDLSLDYIKIRDSTFHNTGFHQVIQALSLDTDQIKQNENDDFVSSIEFRKFRDQGLILNTNGYRGSIEVKDSTFTNNMAYI